jgi:hypothetical protein
MTSIFASRTSQCETRVGETLRAYVDWREKCIVVRNAYDSWAAAGRADAPLAFAAYTAALDREERAAEAYGDVVRGDSARTRREPPAHAAALGNPQE